MSLSLWDVLLSFSFKRACAGLVTHRILRWSLGPLHIQRQRCHGQGERRRPKRKRAGGQGEWAVPYQGAQTRHGVLLVGTRRGGKTHILRRLRSYPKVLGQYVDTFMECSSDIHLLLRETATSVAMRYWRQVGAASVEASSVATYSARYRRHWGAELALQGARLRFSRAYLAFQAPSCQAGMIFGTSSIGFDPADSAEYAAEAARILGGRRSAD